MKQCRLEQFQFQVPSNLATKFHATLKPHKLFIPQEFKLQEKFPSEFDASPAVSTV